MEENRHYRGFLQPLKGQQIPAAHVFLGVQVKGQPVKRLEYGPGADVPVEQLADLICGEYSRYENGVWGRTTELVTKTPATFWTWLIARARPRSCTWIWSLNAYASVTVLGLWHMLETKRFTLAGSDRELQGNKPLRQRKPWEGFIVCADPPTIISIRPTNSTATMKIVDVRNYGVKDYGDLTQLVAADLPNEDWQYDATMGKSYAAREFTAVSHFAKTWVQLVEREGLGSLQCTIAAQADAAFRSRSLEKDTVHVHDDAELLRLERAAVVGGRCEARQLGQIDGDIYHLDIMSAYHFAALNTPVPLHAIDAREAAIYGGSDRNGISVVHVADCDIRTNEPRYPVRMMCDKCKAWREQINSQLATRPCQRCITIYPVGEFRTVLCGEELLAAYKHGHIASIYAQQAYAASKWLHHWATMIQTLRGVYGVHGDTLLSGLIKRIGVSLYGKFSQRGICWRHIKGARHDRQWDTFFQHNGSTGEPELVRVLAGRVERQVRESEHFRSTPIVTACINAAIRCRLWEMLGTCVSGRVYYYNTDSLWTDSTAAGELDDAGWVRPGVTGFLRLKGVYGKLDVRGLNHYVYDDVTVRAGCPLWMSDTCSGDGHTEPIEPITAACIAGRPPSSAVAPTAKECAERYRHGIVLSDGRVVPHVLKK